MSKSSATGFRQMTEVGCVLSMFDGLFKIRNNCPISQWSEERRRQRWQMLHFRNDKLNGIKCFKKLDHWQKLTQSGKRTCQNDFFDRGVFAGENRKGQNGLQHHIDNAESKITIGCAVLYVCKVCGGDFRTELFNVIFGNIADCKINV